MERDSLGKWVMIIAVAVVLVAAIGLMLSLGRKTTLLAINGQVVKARVARTVDERQKGLSGTASLGSKDGMLFVFDESAKWGIWMKDMHYSIDILWLDDAKQVVYKAQDVSPGTYPQVFVPSKAARYVVELPAGYAAEHNVVLGQLIGFSN